VTHDLPREPLARRRVALAGDPAARPDGLERALSRAGFQVFESDESGLDSPPDAIVITTTTAEPDRLAELLGGPDPSPPRVVVFAVDNAGAPALALAAGAEDALAAPVRLAELCARLDARIRERQGPVRTAHETRVRESLHAFVTEARTALRPDEIVLALVRRLEAALGLARCLYVVSACGPDEGRVIGNLPEGAAGRVDLVRFPEIGEATRTGLPVTLAGLGTDLSPDPGPPWVVLPISQDGGVPGVLLLQSSSCDRTLAPAELGMAEELGHAAVRAFRSRGSGGFALADPAATDFDFRLSAEVERARRYSLTLSLVLLGVEGASESADPAGPSETLLRDVSARLRRELRRPDVVSRWGNELVIVLPETAAEGARRWIARLRERLACGALDLDPADRLLGISAGIVSYPHPAVSQPDDLLALAEAALRRGRAQTGERIGIAD